jgi:CRISPR-associated protein Csb2
MSNILLISVWFLDPVPAFHGKRDGGEPEWPPSPLRLFQALVDAAANRWREPHFTADAKPALEWLQQLRPEAILAPPHHIGTTFRIAVPNNDLDAWARPISKGTEPKKQPSELKTMKSVQPTHIRIGARGRGDAIQYLFTLPDDLTEFYRHRKPLKCAARSVTHLGWGIDMVVAEADVIPEADAAKLPGHRWRVVPAGGVPLRVPKPGTLDDLIRKHKDFLNRLSNDGFKPVPPLSCFDVLNYHSPTVAASATPPRPLAAFEIHRTIEDQEREERSGKSKFRPFHHVRRVAAVAGMVRNATATVARRIGWTEEEIRGHVEGHGDGRVGQATTNDRLLFLPLPSITPVGVGGIRRVLVVGPPGFDLSQLRRRLNGEELIDEESKQPVAMLSGIPTTDRNVAHFLAPSRTWSTVTPIILPGYDDPGGLRSRLKSRKTPEQQKNLLARLDTRILSLIWKAFHQAGWTGDALGGAEIEYRAVGWFPGLDVARSYELPPIQFPRYHLRIQFPHAVAGPLCIGSGRYRGVGVFASEMK